MQILEHTRKKPQKSKQKKRSKDQCCSKTTTRSFVKASVFTYIVDVEFFDEFFATQKICILPKVETDALSTNGVSAMFTHCAQNFTAQLY